MIATKTTTEDVVLSCADARGESSISKRSALVASSERRRSWHSVSSCASCIALSPSDKQDQYIKCRHKNWNKHHPQLQHQQQWQHSTPSNNSNSNNTQYLWTHRLLVQNRKTHVRHTKTAMVHQQQRLSVQIDLSCVVFPPSFATVLFLGALQFNCVSQSVGGSNINMDNRCCLL